jgi:hypothetical protein
MNISKEHFVSEEAYDEYERGINWFYSELVRLNTTIYIMERISEFPFRLFGEMGRMTFFNMVMSNFLDVAVLISAKLITDRDGEKHTLRRFKNKLKQLIKAEYQDTLNERLRRARLDSTANKLLVKLKKYRDEYVAHLNRSLVEGKSDVEALNMSDLLKLRDILNSLFEVITLKDDTEYMMVFLEYSPNVLNPPGSERRSDIEEILDNIARESAVLNLPERHPQRWKYQQQQMSREDLDRLNHYRKKFGLPEV